MTSVQDYLRELRAARKEFAAGSKPGTAATTTEQHVGGSPAINRSAASPWLKSPAVSKPLPSAPVRDGGGGEPASVRQGAGRGRPSVAPANSLAVRGTGRAAVAPAPGRPSPGAAGARGGEGRSPARPVKPSAAAGGRTPPEDADSDTDISHLIDQLSLKSPAKAAAPRRGSKMEMLRRKFSTSSPTKSWADLGSSGGSLSRPRARSSVSIQLTLHRTQGIKERTPNAPCVIYVAGGYLRFSLDKMECYAPCDRVWHELAPLPDARSGLRRAGQ
ncbi:translation initiation factor IF-2-like [Pollicipes pollicipes]|uniref:translation initiation factor IF-2-like n=1 Tax=Pollicipes pollicipes TaxID=41117 RepID=UPI001884A866|nr:translation initiation factor IF-2-like [Pollicipes pollicipes]